MQTSDTVQLYVLYSLARPSNETCESSATESTLTWLVAGRAGLLLPADPLAAQPAASANAASSSGVRALVIASPTACGQGQR